MFNYYHNDYIYIFFEISRIMSSSRLNFHVTTCTDLFTVLLVHRASVNIFLSGQPWRLHVTFFDKFGIRVITSVTYYIC